ncbi:putative RNA-binding Zn-ribbon protein involved in translation (DUF1610 family) [Sedimentibacter acidaminivorans]|uniref:RNA-binding Zn-ribbon protein involved in translation (DUF1610 family) n=1 Tax=Sedimentibacter acidaminivorans TaxID=913099 RepID=A0ABS4GBN2_9FIRM|nr:PF20097 family protein [Sedimentibacter acidaminivorans]MBP1925098.1 putative RNA-binding Zn-ribbon protein involved in translation (DUF1610 family) [Sedimentibacter acidaminivorans]
MKCPKCGVEMNTGYLQTGNLVAFNKQRHKISLNSKDPEDVMVSRRAFTSNDFTGYICKQCGLIVFDYLNPKTRL